MVTIQKWYILIILRNTVSFRVLHGKFCEAWESSTGLIRTLLSTLIRIYLLYLCEEYLRYSPFSLWDGRGFSVQVQKSVRTACGSMEKEEEERKGTGDVWSVIGLLFLKNIFYFKIFFIFKKLFLTLTYQNDMKIYKKYILK